MSDHHFSISQPEKATIVEVGGAEIVIRFENGKLLINVVAPGNLDPNVFHLDHEGDAQVEFFANGRQGMQMYLYKGPRDV